jgi:nucleoside-diphosphate-sugar epimerase
MGGGEPGGRRTVLVVGSSGLVGNAAVRAFAAHPDFEVWGGARRVVEEPGATIVPLDLDDAERCRQLAAELGPRLTHLVFAAQAEAAGLAPGWFDDGVIDRNLAMFRNLIDPLAAQAPKLEHVALLQGGRAYGIHAPEIAPAVRLPLREREPRPPIPSWYFLQEDHLCELADGRWRITVLRPSAIYGGAAGANMNPLVPLGIYAALEAEAGARELAFPGATFDRHYAEAVDTDLVGDALVWAATEDAADFAIYNVTNGDLFNWVDVWPAIAGSFGMDPGAHLPMSFAGDLPGRDPEWAEIVRRHRLRAPASILEFAGANSLVAADWMVGGLEDENGPVVPFVNSTIAIRRAGFTGCIDTEDMFMKWFRRLQDQALLPPRAAVGMAEVGR